MTCTCRCGADAARSAYAAGEQVRAGKTDPNRTGDIPFLLVEGDGDEVDLRFVPMACQRCHETVFPQLTASHRRGL